MHEDIESEAQNLDNKVKLLKVSQISQLRDKDENEVRTHLN